MIPSIRSCSACSESPCARHASEAEPLIGYPVLTSAVEGHPIYTFIPTRTPTRLRRRRSNRCACSLILLLFIVVVTSFLVWPRSLQITVADLTLSNIHFNVKKGDYFIPRVFIDLSLDLHLLANNPNFFRVTYENVTLSILFEGDEIAQVESYGADLDALSTSYVNATLEVHSYQIASNVLRLLADIASKALPLQTYTTCKGHINFFLIKLPLEGTATCNLVVNPQEELIISQDCDA